MIRVGIIGYGYMGQFHKKKIVQSGQASVVAILDKEQRRREEGLSDGYHVYSEKQLETFSFHGLWSLAFLHRMGASVHPHPRHRILLAGTLHAADGGQLLRGGEGRIYRR